MEKSRTSKFLFLSILILMLVFSSSALAFDAKELALQNNRLALMNGDVNADGKVDVFDLASIGIYYGTEEGDSNWNWKADISNTENKIDIFDLAEVGLNYGNNYIQAIDDPVFISPPLKNVILNQEFSVSADISTPANVYAVDLKLSFNPSIVQALNVSKGDFLSKDGAEVYVVSSIDNLKGEIEFASTRIGTSTDVTGEGSLAEIKFKAMNVGKTDVSFLSLTVIDSNLNEVANISTIKGEINVSSEPGENTPPIISGIPDKNINEDTAPPEGWIDLYPYANDLEDSDDALTFSIESQTNSALINCYISKDRYLECSKPTANQHGYNDVNIKVRDTGGLNDTDIVRITVNSINDVPVIDSYSPLANPTIQEKESQAFSISASDADGESLTIKWYLDGKEVASGNSYTYWSDESSQGAHKVKAVVSDGKAQAEHSWTLTVLDTYTRIFLTAGNNIFSLPRNQQKTFNELKTDCEVVFEESRADLAYYIPNGENISLDNYVFVSLDKILYPGQGYFIKVIDDCSIEMSEANVVVSDLGYLGTKQLKTGWNLIGSPTNPIAFSAGTCQLFNNVGILKYAFNVASCNSVEGYNGGYSYCTLEGGINRCRCEVDNFEPGEGYWIRTANDCSLS